MLQAILAETVNNMDQSDLFAQVLSAQLLSGCMESKNRISLLSQGLPL